MSKFEDHCARDLEIGLSQSYPEVHTLLDQFAHYPEMGFLRRHRKFLHHEQGIEYVTMRWGAEAGQAAWQHITDDCGHVPRAQDYYNRRVNDFGALMIRDKTWFSEESS
jgi:hypothetical protein